MENLIQAIQDGCACDVSVAYDLLNAEVQKLRTLGQQGTLKSSHICEACDRLKINRNLHQFKFIVLLDEKHQKESVIV